MSTEIGKVLKQARLDLGMRNKDVVEAIGISAGHLSRIETGASYPNGHLPSLCKLYGIDEKDLPGTKPGRRKRAKKAARSSRPRVDILLDMMKLAVELHDEDLIADIAVRLAGSR